MVVIESALERLELVAVDGGAEGELMYRSGNDPVDDE